MNGYIQDVWIFVPWCKLWNILRIFLRITVNFHHISNFVTICGHMLIELGQESPNELLDNVLYYISGLLVL